MALTHIQGGGLVHDDVVLGEFHLPHHLFVRLSSDATPDPENVPTATTASPAGSPTTASPASDTTASPAGAPISASPVVDTAEPTGDTRRRILQEALPTCPTSDGILGLGNNRQETLGGTVVPSWLFDEGLRHAFWSLSPTTLILGGVNRKQYQDCLKWMPVTQVEDILTTKHWEVELLSVSVGQETMPKHDFVRFQPGLLSIEGSAEAVAKIIAHNQLQCQNRTDDGFTQVDCAQDDQALPVDRIVTLTDCHSSSFEGLTFFMADGSSHVVGKQELLNTNVDDGACVVSITSSPTANWWTLGRPFLETKYVAFDGENQRIGIATAAHDAQDNCAEDWMYDVDYDGVPQTPPTPAPISQDAVVTAAPHQTPHKPEKEATEEPLPEASAPSWTVLGVLVLIVLAMLWCRRRNERRAKREQYQLASRYHDDDDGIGLGELEMN